MGGSSRDAGLGSDQLRSGAHQPPRKRAVWSLCARAHSRTPDPPAKGSSCEASGTTSFLDEIGEMPLDMQAKLLRALQERDDAPCRGPTSKRPSNRESSPPTQRRHRGGGDRTPWRFREDLYHRINVVAIHVPALRDRPEDILALATHFLRRAAKNESRPEIRLSPEVGRILLAYDWPGNVRELENCIERAVALARHDYVSAEDLRRPGAMPFKPRRSRPLPPRQL